jgi:hypothetical protein
MEQYVGERPAGMSDEKYERTLRARAFDVARYLLPMGIRTGLGQILSARTLERMLVRLLSHPLEEIRAVARELKAAATVRPAFNPMVERLRPLLAELEELTDDERARGLIEIIKTITGFDAAAVPTLVKYAEPSAYLIKTRAALAEMARKFSQQLGEPDGRRGAELTPPQDPLTETACTLLYRTLPHSYTQIAAHLRELSPGEVREIVAAAHRHRGPHDAPIREARAGYRLVFDLCLDCGAWRDFHRHRRLVQVHKPFGAEFGYDLPSEIGEAGLAESYCELMDEAGRLCTAIDAARPGVGAGQYALPFAYRRRSLFKMDVEELQYIVELRTRPENHFSVRRVAYEMFERFRERHPELARHFRVVPPEREEFFKR